LKWIKKMGEYEKERRVEVGGVLFVKLKLSLETIP
jgi:prefoldin subunit 5